jgi:hypothetical protein
MMLYCLNLMSTNCSSYSTSPLFCHRTNPTPSSPSHHPLYYSLVSIPLLSSFLQSLPLSLSSHPPLYSSSSPLSLFLPSTPLIGPGHYIDVLSRMCGKPNKKNIFYSTSPKGLIVPKCRADGPGPGAYSTRTSMLKPSHNMFLHGA